MVKKYESLAHICIEGLVLVRSDERERYGKKGTTSKHGDLKQRKFPRWGITKSFFLRTKKKSCLFAQEIKLTQRNLEEGM